GCTARAAPAPGGGPPPFPSRGPAAGRAPRTRRAAARRRREPRRDLSWRRYRFASCRLGGLRGACDQVVQVRDGTARARQVEEELPVALRALERRWGDSAHVPA